MRVFFPPEKPNNHSLARARASQTAKKGAGKMSDSASDDSGDDAMENFDDLLQPPEEGATLAGSPPNGEPGNRPPPRPPRPPPPPRWKDRHKHSVPVATVENILKQREDERLGALPASKRRRLHDDIDSDIGSVEEPDAPLVFVDSSGRPIEAIVATNQSAPGSPKTPSRPTASVNGAGGGGGGGESLVNVYSSIFASEDSNHSIGSPVRPGSEFQVPASRSRKRKQPGGPAGGSRPHSEHSSDNESVDSQVSYSGADPDPPRMKETESNVHDETKCGFCILNNGTAVPEVIRPQFQAAEQLITDTLRSQNMQMPVLVNTISILYHKKMRAALASALKFDPIYRSILPSMHTDQIEMHIRLKAKGDRFVRYMNNIKICNELAEIAAHRALTARRKLAHAELTGLNVPDIVVDPKEITVILKLQQAAEMWEDKRRNEARILEAAAASQGGAAAHTNAASLVDQPFMYVKYSK